MKPGKLIAVLAGPLLGALVAALLLRAEHSWTLSIVAGTGVWMALWWIAEAVSIYVTALLPAVLLHKC